MESTASYGEINFTVKWTQDEPGGDWFEEAITIDGSDTDIKDIIRMDVYEDLIMDAYADLEEARHENIRAVV